MKRMMAGTSLGHGTRPHIVIALIILTVLYCTNGVAGTMTAVTGGSAISADTTSAAGGSGAWTSLTGPEYWEANVADLGMGAVILTAPAGFEFNPASTVSVRLISGDANTNKNINDTAVGGTLATATVTATTITWSVVTKSNGQARNRFTWLGIQVRPTAGAPLAGGNIIPSGESGIGSYAAGAGTLNEVAGAAKKLFFLQQPSNAGVNVTISPAITVAIQDQFGNTVTTNSSTVTLAIGSNPGGGTLSGAASVAAVSGVATFSTLSINMAGIGYTLAASAPGLTGVTSNGFNITSALDHYEIIHDGMALTCAPKDVTVAVCADTGCTMLGTISATVTLSPAGWVGGDTVMFTGSKHVQLIHTIPGTVSLGISAQNPPAVNGYRCVQTLGGPAVSCDMRFYESGFDFDIPVQTSCKESENIIITATGRDPASGQCVPLFAGRTENISFWFTYINPNTGIEAVRVNGAPVSGGAPGTSIALAFDANGHSTFKLVYHDAGQLQLNARYIGAGAETGLEMPGGDSFVTAPAGLCVYSDAANSDCASGDAACSVFVAAGDPFALKVKGVCWQADGETDAQFCDNTTTANFRMNNISLSQSLVAPATGVSGAITLSSADITAPGEVEVQQSVSEVGVFTFTADPPNDYLGAGDVFAGATFTSANIGRFIPHHFDVSLSPDPPAFADSCTGTASSFTYLGQSFNWAIIPQLTIRAMNGAGAVTRNYEGAFWRLANPLASYTYVDANAPISAAPLTPAASSQTLPSTADCDGTVTAPLNELTGFNYTRPLAAAPVSPFVPDVALSISQAGLTDADNVCYDLGAGAGCQGFVVDDITGTHLRHGRVKILNNFGPETADITHSPFEAQYYNGTNWVVNVDDACTTALNFCPAARVSAVQPVPLSAGKGTMTVKKPDSVTVCPTAPAWLTALTDCSVPDSSCGEFTFGIYRGNDRIINWQEIMQ